MVRSRVSRKVCAQIAGGALALVVGLGFSSGALAVNEVRTTVTGGNLTASIQNLNLGNVAYSHANTNKSGTMVLTVDDRTGTSAGWHVTVVASDFDYFGPNPGTDIPAANFTLTAANAAGYVSGQGLDAAGPIVPSVSPVGTLDQVREVLESGVGFGKGRYTQDLDVTLVVPGDSLVGTYTSTLTVDAVAGP